MRGCDAALPKMLWDFLLPSRSRLSCDDAASNLTPFFPFFCQWDFSKPERFHLRSNRPLQHDDSKSINDLTRAAVVDGTCSSRFIFIFQSMSELGFTFHTSNYCKRIAVNNISVFYQYLAFSLRPGVLEQRCRYRSTLVWMLSL